MDNLFNVGGAGAGGSLLGLVLGYFGLGNRIKAIEKDMKEVVYEDRFIEYKEGHAIYLKKIDDTLVTIQGDIKTLIGKKE